MRSNYDYSVKLKGCFICHAILLSLPGKIKMISIFVLQICQSWSLCNVLVHSMGSMIGWLQSYCTHDWNYITLHTLSTVILIPQAQPLTDQHAERNQ